MIPVQSVQHCKEQLSALAQFLYTFWKHYQRVVIYAYYPGARLKSEVDSYEKAVSRIVTEIVRPALTPAVPGRLPLVHSVTLTRDRNEKRQHIVEITIESKVFEETNTP